VLLDRHYRLLPPGVQVAVLSAIGWLELLRPCLMRTRLRESR
jgi:hypothetical protein